MKKLSLFVALGLFTFGAATIVKAQLSNDITDASVQPSSDDIIIEFTEKAEEIAPKLFQTDECVDTDGDGVADDCDGDGKPDTDNQQ
ncbi:hypothetical protein Xen7305DRAFT_00031830 [Xenococcus sp. PCC 7305]|uniref:hypothetical protein n=1 Tax=Xenococcus sp. PCC 7305 TaxID=102125 RepID=UPI0002ACA58E|nr:hypothetical protein [Xenococcus sp. PCC 7305]ELS03459.1 hypothetical protein Xen7305DRAFT_00031830 [Xenococcus sp. PCC 7305]